jgi:hypothetical protein
MKNTKLKRTGFRGNSMEILGDQCKVVFNWIPYWNQLRWERRV